MICVPLFCVENADAGDEEKKSSSSSQALSTSSGALTFSELSVFLTEFDLRRLESYAKNLMDYHMILDLVPHVRCCDLGVRDG